MPSRAVSPSRPEVHPGSPDDATEILRCCKVAPPPTPSPSAGLTLLGHPPRLPDKESQQLNPRPVLPAPRRVQQVWVLVTHESSGSRECQPVPLTPGTWTTTRGPICPHTRPRRAGERPPCQYQTRAPGLGPPGCTTWGRGSMPAQRTRRHPEELDEGLEMPDSTESFSDSGH